MADEISQFLDSREVEFCALFEKWEVDGPVGARRSIGRAKNPEVGSSTVSLAFPRISPPARETLDSLQGGLKGRDI